MKRPKFLPLVGRIPAGAELHLITKVFWHQENTRKSYVWCELLLNCPAGRAHTDHWWKPGSLWELRRKAQSWQCPTASPGRAHRAQWWTWGRRGRAEGLSLAQEERTQQKKSRLNCDVPDFVATRVEHVQVHVLHQNGRSALHGTTRQVHWSLRSFQTSRTGSSWVVARNVRHLCLRVGAEDLGPTLHWSVVVEVLLDLLHRSGSTVVGSVNWLSYSGGNVHNRSQLWTQPWQSSGAETTVALTLLFLHFHHLPLPLVKSGDVLRVFRAHTRICVCGGRGALGLSKIMRKPELGHFLWHGERKIAQVLSEFLTCCTCDVLESKCRLPGPAAGVRGGSVCVLVPAVWTLEMFSKIVGGLLWGEGRKLWARPSDQSPADKYSKTVWERIFLARPTCQYHMGFSHLHSQLEACRLQSSQLQLHQRFHQAHWKK